MQRGGEILLSGEGYLLSPIIQFQVVSPEDIHTNNIMYELSRLSGIYKHTHTCKNKEKEAMNLKA